MKYLAAIIIAALLVLGVLAIADAIQPGKHRESICTMDGDQARAFARQCKAGGGELSIYEYSCERRDE